MKKIVRVFIFATFLVVMYFLGTQENVAASSLHKVSDLKKTTEYRYYKGWKSTTAKKMSKIKYKYGYRISWKTVKGSDGYEVYRYGSATKMWNRIKITKKNYYILTRTLSGYKTKFRVRAYKRIGNETQYSDFSPIISFKTVFMNKIGTNASQKNFYDRYAAESAFVIQNQFRKEKGVQELKWSDEIYQCCLYRLKKSGYDRHKNFLRDVHDYFGDYYELKDGVGCFGENLSTASNPQSAMAGWKKSPGHYRNLLSERYQCGAIAFGDVGTIALFSDIPYNEMENWRTYENTSAKIIVKRIDKATGQILTGSRITVYNTSDREGTRQVKDITVTDGTSFVVPVIPGSSCVIFESIPPVGYQKATREVIVPKVLKEGINIITLSD